jgi:transposase
VLNELNRSFGRLYHMKAGRRSHPNSCRVLLLQEFYGIRSQRRRMEQLNSSLLFRWFVGLLQGDPARDATKTPRSKAR